MIDSILSIHAIKQAHVSKKHSTRQNIAVGKQFGKDSYFIMAELCEGWKSITTRKRKIQILQLLFKSSFLSYCHTVQWHQIVEKFFNLKAQISSNKASIKHLHSRSSIHTEFVNQYQLGQEIFSAVVTKRKKEVKDFLSIRRWKIQTVRQRFRWNYNHY